MSRSFSRSTRLDDLSASPLRARHERAGGRAGALAALAMLALQLLWRLAWSSSGVQAFPELVVGAISRLTPLGLFGLATETFGSLAQNTLFVAVLVGIIAVGHEAGAAAGRLVASGRTGAGHTGRLSAGLIVATVLWLFSVLVILPVANLGVLARDSRHATEILVQLGVTMALFALAWAALSSPTGPAGDGRAATVNRRSFVERAAWGGGTLALLLGVGGMGWRLMRPGVKGDPAAAERATRQILANAEARGAAPAAVAAPTSAAVPRLDGENNVAAAADPEATDATSPGASSSSFAALEASNGLTPLLTTVPDFYHVSKNISDPTVDGEGWSLRIDGLVDRPLAIGYEELVSRATTRKITTLCCISNELNGDLIGTAEWQGIPLRDLLAQAGVQDGTVDLKLSCTDQYEDSITLERALDPDTLVVVGMNGEPLPPDHGYPARLIVPGIYGMKNVKWLERIELVAEDFLGYWQTRGWSDPAPYQIWARIDVPGGDGEVAPGEAVVAGVASAGDRGVSRVEVSVDDGQTWADAELEPALNPPFTWIRWKSPFAAAGEEHRIVVRVTDGEGTVAPEERQPPLPDGATGWPSRTVEIRS